MPGPLGQSWAWMNRGGRAARIVKWGAAAILVLLILTCLLFVPIVNLIVRHELVVQVTGLVDGRLELGGVSYKPPFGLTLSNLRLIPDGANESFLDIGNIQVSLASLPWGGPIVVDNLGITDPVVHLVYLPSGQIQFPQLHFKSTQTSGPAAKTSAVIRLQHGSVQHVVLELDAQNGSGGAAHSIIGQLNTTMELTGNSGADYDVKLSASQPPLLQMDFSGQINVDTGVLTVNTFTLHGQASQWNQPPFPPAIAALCTQHNVTGAIDATASGTVPLMDPQSKAASLRLTLNHFQGSCDGVDLSLAEPAVMTVESGALVSRGLRFDAAGGAILVDSIQLGMWPPYEYGTKLAFEQIDVSKFRRIANLGASGTALSGTAQGTLSASGQLPAGSSDLLSTLKGDGKLAVHNADFWDIPVLSSVAGHLNTDFSKVGRIGEAGAVFDFGDNRAHFSKLAVSSPAIGVQGSGYVGFNSDVDLSLVAVPLAGLKSEMNKTGIPLLGSLVGKVQGAFAKASNLLYSFHVTGNLANPQVTPVAAPALTKDASDVFDKMINPHSGTDLLNAISSPFKSAQSK
jgi:AsmA-like C-terminal region